MLTANPVDFVDWASYSGTSSNAALVNLALKETGGTQKDLAKRLNVSPSQVSQWKADENAHMSNRMRLKLMKLAKIPADRPQATFAQLAGLCGSVEGALKWERLIFSLRDEVCAGVADGHFPSDFEADSGDLLVWTTLEILWRMGVQLPSAAFPVDVANPYASLIRRLYDALVRVSVFYYSHIQVLLHEEKEGETDLWEAGVEHISCNLLDLAACKIEVDRALAPDYDQFRYGVLAKFKDVIQSLKEAVFEKGIPLRVELMDLVEQDANALATLPAPTSLDRIHPDVYMNELLMGMRAIQQVLPAIMEKLGVERQFLEKK